MRFVPRMWQNLEIGRSFDAILVVTANAAQRVRMRSHFRQNDAWAGHYAKSPIQFASLDELRRPWKGGNFDASLFAIQRIRQLLQWRGISEMEGRSLIVLAAGEGTRAYPITAAERGNKCMIRTPAEVQGRSLRLVELVIAQYHQILDDLEPGRIHIAAGDHFLSWAQPPRHASHHEVRIFAHGISFADEAREAGLLTPDGRPRWEDGVDLRKRLRALDLSAQLPVLTALGQMGLLKTRAPEEDLVGLVEKPDVATALEDFADSGGEAHVSWWDWSLSLTAARILVGAYADLVGTGIDLSMDVLEALTMELQDWCRRRPARNPELWHRANMVFENPKTPGPRPLGPIGVADPGKGSIFADVGTLQNLHRTYASALLETARGEDYRRLLGAKLEDGAIYCGERPGSRVSVEAGAMVIEGSGIRSGHIGAGSIIVGTTARELRAEGDCIVYGVRAPGRKIRARKGEVSADVMHRGRRHTVRADLFAHPDRGDKSGAWYRPHHGNPMSFSDLHSELLATQSRVDLPRRSPPGREPARKSAARPEPPRHLSWKHRPPAPDPKPHR
jgi:hypothetical protein